MRDTGGSAAPGDTARVSDDSRVPIEVRDTNGLSLELPAS